MGPKFVSDRNTRVMFGQVSFDHQPLPASNRSVKRGNRAASVREKCIFVRLNLATQYLTTKL